MSEDPGWSPSLNLVLKVESIFWQLLACIFGGKIVKPFFIEQADHIQVN